jgi:V/A-type H+-transporting ATPase subunit D
MLKSYLPWLRPHVVIESVQKRAANVAGVSVPIFGGVQFSRARYSLLGTPPFFDTAVEYLQRALAAREELKVLREQQERLQRELTKTTQRINLYQEVLIPEARDNIHRIRVYLGDQYTAAVCRAKIAKDKLLARGAAQRSAT